MIGSLLVVVRRPKGEEFSTLGIRTAWATHAAAIETKLLYIEDGVYNLIESPGYNTEMLKKFIGEGGAVYALRSHMEERGLTGEGFVQGVEIIPPEDVPDLVEECEASTIF